MDRFTYEHEPLYPHEMDVGGGVLEGYVIRDTGLPVAICQDRDWAEVIVGALNAANKRSA
jgi:hypothetical protein